MDPVDPTRPTDPTDPTPKPGPNDNKVTGNGGEAEEEGEPLSVMFWIFIAGIFAVLLVGGYCAYLYMKRKRTNHKIKSQLSSEIDRQGGGNRGDPSKNKNNNSRKQVKGESRQVSKKKHKALAK